MKKTQIQIPDKLYMEVKRVAAERELSFAEVVRRGIEYVVRIYPSTGSNSKTARKKWSPPILPAKHFRPDADKLDLKSLLEKDLTNLD